jgi:hypothetical protein
MDNVLQDMVQRLRAIELLLRKQNEFMSRVLGELEQTRLCAEASQVARKRQPSRRAMAGDSCREAKQAVRRALKSSWYQS